MVQKRDYVLGEKGSIRGNFEIDQCVGEAMHDASTRKEARNNVAEECELFCGLNGIVKTNGKFDVNYDECYPIERMREKRIKRE